MRNLVQQISRLDWWKQLAIGLMFLLIVLTWLAVCLILASYLVA